MGFLGAVDDLRSRRQVLLVAEPGAGAGPFLDKDLRAVLAKLPHAGRGKSHAPLG
jgi:hypothetical protein